MLEDKYLSILLVCKRIREDLRQLRRLIGVDEWLSDENLRAVDTIIYMQEQNAYNKLQQTAEQSKTNIIKNNLKHDKNTSGVKFEEVKK